jgi:hypothetical protein
MTLAAGDKPTQIRYMLDHCADFEERMTEWERNFLESITEQFEQRGSLSEKQIEVVERIYCKCP